MEQLPTIFLAEGAEEEDFVGAFGAVLRLFLSQRRKGRKARKGKNQRANSKFKKNSSRRGRRGAEERRTPKG